MADARGGQQGTLTRMWAKRDTRPPAPRDQRRVLASILDAGCPQRSTTSALVLPDHNARSLSFPRADSSRQIAAGAPAVLLPCGAGLHSANDLAIPGNISWLRLPPNAPAPG